MATSIGMSSYKDIPSFESVDPLSDTDEPCFNEIRDVLIKYNALNRFGICLLHEHFQLAPNEVLVEFVDEINRSMTIKPMKAEEIKEGRILETIWRFDYEPTQNASDPKKPIIPTRKCKQQCVWEDNPNGTRTHHIIHRPMDSPT